MASIGGLPAGAAAAAGYAGALPPLVARGPVPAYPPGAAGAAGYAGMTAAAPVDPRVKLQQQRALDARANPANSLTVDFVQAMAARNAENLKELHTCVQNLMTKFPALVVTQFSGIAPAEVPTALAKASVPQPHIARYQQLLNMSFAGARLLAALADSSGHFVSVSKADLRLFFCRPEDFMTLPDALRALMMADPTPFFSTAEVPLAAARTAAVAEATRVHLAAMAVSEGAVAGVAPPKPASTAAAAGGAAAGGKAGKPVDPIAVAAAEFVDSIKAGKPAPTAGASTAGAAAGLPATVMATTAPGPGYAAGYPAGVMPVVAMGAGARAAAAAAAGGGSGAFAPGSALGRSGVPMADDDERAGADDDVEGDDDEDYDDEEEEGEEEDLP